MREEQDDRKRIITAKIFRNRGGKRGIGEQPVSRNGTCCWCLTTRQQRRWLAKWLRKESREKFGGIDVGGEDR